MSEIDAIVEQMQISRVDHLPIVAAFCRRIGLIETVNATAETGMAVDVGTVVQAMNSVKRVFLAELTRKFNSHVFGKFDEYFLRYIIQNYQIVGIDCSINFLMIYPLEGRQFVMENSFSFIPR